jgi:hypothetical protein
MWKPVTQLLSSTPEDAALKLASMLRAGKLSPLLLVDVAGGKVEVDTDEGFESVTRDDRNRIGPVVQRKEGPTSVVTSPVMAAFCGHDKVESKTDLEYVNGSLLRLRSFGAEAFYQWVAADGTASEPFAVITVQRRFAHQDTHPATHLALAAYGAAAQQ